MLSVQGCCTHRPAFRSAAAETRESCSLLLQSVNKHWRAILSSDAGMYQSLRLIPAEVSVTVLCEAARIGLRLLRSPQLNANNSLQGSQDKVVHRALAIAARVPDVRCICVDVGCTVGSLLQVPCSSSLCGHPVMFASNLLIAAPRGPSRPGDCLVTACEAQAGRRYSTPPALDT